MTTILTTPLATLEDFAAVRGQSFDPTDQQAVIALEQASGLVRSYTGRSFDLTTSDITMDGSGKFSLVLPNPPIVSVAEVTLDDEVLDPTTYSFDAGPGILWRTDNYARWTAGRQNVEITYTHGFETIPPEVAGATILRAMRLYASYATDASGPVRQRSVGSFNVTYAAGTNTDGSFGLEGIEKAMLAEWKLTRVA